MKKVKVWIATLVAAFLGMVGFGGATMQTNAVQAEEGAGFEITLSDSYGDGWNEAALEFYAGGELTDTFTLNDGDTYTFTKEYDHYTYYEFRWVKGLYDSECSFRIFLDGVQMYSLHNADNVQNGEIVWRLYPDCEHSFNEDWFCTICENSCGVEMAHIFEEGVLCTICSLQCGVTAPHEWNADMGVCMICQTVCAHNFENYVCTECSFTYKLMVTDGLGNTEYYTNFEDAATYAKTIENAKITFLNDTEIPSYNINQTIGTLVLDLNGKVVTMRSSLMFSKSVHVKIIDSSVEQTGKITINGSAVPTLSMIESSTVELCSGTIEQTRPICVVNTTHGGNKTNSTFIMSGGTLIAIRSLIEHGGANLVITGGNVNIPDGERFYISWRGGALKITPPSILAKLDLCASTTWYDDTAPVFEMPDDFTVNGEYDNGFILGKTYTFRHLNCTYEYDCSSDCLVCLHPTREVTHSGGQATCKALAICEHCTQPYGEYADHVWDEGKIITPATCCSTGVMTYVCTVDDTHTFTIEIPFNEDAHSFGEWQVTKQPTEKTQGNESRSCACGEVETRSIPAQGKGCGSVVIIPASAVTLIGAVTFVTLKKKKYKHTTPSDEV